MRGKASLGQRWAALTKQFDRKNVDPYLWNDVVMVDQHAAATVDFDFNVWSKTFEHSLKKIGKALFGADTW